MIRFFTLKILNIFDFYYQKKLFSFLKSRGYKNFDVLFDIGAHHGESIKRFSNNFKIKNIYSFEASDKNFSILQKNLIYFKKKFNNTNIVIENYAAGDEEKSIKMKQMNESSSSTINSYNIKSKYFKKKSMFLLSSKKQNFFSEIDVKQVLLSKYMTTNQIKKIDFIKIDTEGYEYYVLKGLKNQFQKIKLILFEHHYHSMLLKNYKFRDIHNILIKNNFKQIYKYKMAFRKTFEYVYELQE
tara:strand:+ start:55 stop:780 length:726 start_codon:yes stop_codon:yes gene_type:complete